MFSGAEPRAACAAAGDAIEAAYCGADSDCGPGLACTGRCLRYCCAAKTSSEGCDLDHYCTGLPLTERPTHKVPVCAPLVPCELLKEDGLICTVGKETCSVVRNDGATTCVPVGPKKNCEDCSEEACEAGLVCLGPSDSRKCRTLCKIDDPKCGSGRCEGLSSIPKGFGICSVDIDAGCGI